MLNMKLSKVALATLMFSYLLNTACSSLQYSAATQSAGTPVTEASGWNRRPASEERSALMAGSSLRVKRNMHLSPLKVGGSYRVYFANGKVLKAAEVEDIQAAHSPRTTSYCVIYTDKSAKAIGLKAGQVLALEEVPAFAHWDPGHVYSTSGVEAIQGVGCYSLTRGGRSDVSDQNFRDHFAGIFELAR